MIDYFLRHYKNKTRKELEAIVSSHTLYQKEAVRAAMQLLENKFDTAVREIEFEEDKHRELLEEKIDGNSAEKRQGLYFRTFSRREVSSAFTVALLYFALLGILEYYNDEDWVSHHYRLIQGILFVGLNIINHIFYKREHGRSNLFWGRMLQISLTCVFVYIFRALDALVNDYFYLYDNYMTSLIFTILLMVPVIELLLSMLRRILLFFKWHIW